MDDAQLGIAMSHAILGGSLDSRLDAIIDDVQARRKVLARERAAIVLGLPDGTPVRLVHVSPKVANGATGVLTRDTWNGELGIKLDYSITSRLRAGEAITYPPGCYEAI